MDKAPINNYKIITIHQCGECPHFGTDLDVEGACKLMDPASWGRKILDDCIPRWCPLPQEIANPFGEDVRIIPETEYQSLKKAKLDILVKVGEWLDKKTIIEGGDFDEWGIEVHQEEIDALKRGEMPE